MRDKPLTLPYDEALRVLKQNPHAKITIAPESYLRAEDAHRAHQSGPRIQARRERDERERIRLETPYTVGAARNVFTVARAVALAGLLGFVLLCAEVTAEILGRVLIAVLP